MTNFNDHDLWNNGLITAMSLHCGDYSFGIRIQYDGTWSSQHSCLAQDCIDASNLKPDITFNHGEHIVSVDVEEMYGHVASLTFTTNKRKLQKCGSSDFNVTQTESGGRLEYISGMYTDWYLMQLQFHWSD